MTQNLQISWLLPIAIMFLVHHHIHIAPTLHMIVSDPVRGADVPFLFVEGDEGRGSAVGLGRAVLFVVERDGDADHGVDAGDVEGEVRFEC